MATLYLPEIKEKNSHSIELTEAWPDVQSFLLEKSEDPTCDFLSLQAAIRQMREALIPAKREVRESDAHLDIETVYEGFVDRITSAIREEAEGESMPLMGQYEDAVPFVAITIAQEALSETLEKTTPANPLNEGMHPKELEVDQMVNRAKKGKPPKKPYIPDMWKDRGGVKAFVSETYGHLLDASNPENNFLYQDQLSWIHPDKAKRKKLVPEFVDNPELIGNHIWGIDVVKSLKNSTDISALVLPSTARTQKEIENAPPIGILKKHASLLKAIQIRSEKT